MSHWRRSLLWKWFVFLLLVAFAALLILHKPRSRAVKLLPFKDSPPEWDGSYPYLIVSPVDGGSAHKFRGSTSLVKPTVRHDLPISEFGVDLHSGMFVLRQTDLFVPDVIPLSLTRTYAVWYPSRMSFGVGASHPYDICPTGTRFPYTYMNLNLEDGRQIHFPRISDGTGYADAVFRHNETSSEFYGAQIAWNGDGWTLNFLDRSQFVFPEAYYAKTCAQGAAFEMRDRESHRVRMRRDKTRNLEELISPSGHTITFKYDSADRIVEATDDSGNIRKYSYNSNGHLEIVANASLVLYRFAYEPLLHDRDYDPYMMTTVMDGSGRVLLRNVYGDGSRVSEQWLADGEIYKFDYLFDKKYNVVQTTVTLPSGGVKQFFFHDGIPSAAK